MFQVLWDASALAKRYVAEIGSQTVNALFMAVPPAQMVTTIMSCSETFAALLRKHNQGVLSVTALTAAQAALRNEVIDNPDFVVVGLEFDDILDGIELIKRHNHDQVEFDAERRKSLASGAAALSCGPAAAIMEGNGGHTSCPRRRASGSIWSEGRGRVTSNCA